MTNVFGGVISVSYPAALSVELWNAKGYQPLRPKLYLFGLLMALSLVARGQERYADIPAGEKHTIHDNNFESSEGWAASKRVDFIGGMAVMKKAEISRPIELDFNRSFEIEFYIAADDRYLHFQLLLDDQKLSFTPRFRAMKAFDMVPALKIMQVDQVNSNYSGTSLESFNIGEREVCKYTIRKYGSLYYIFAKEQLIVTYYFPPFKRLTIAAPWAPVIRVDRIVVSYLDSGGEMIPAQPSGLAAQAMSSGPGPDKPGRFFGLLIGVSDYLDNRLDLEKPARDAQQLKAVLTRNYVFTDSTIAMLINPTRQNILVALYNLRKVVGPRDNLLIFYAGHGYWDEDARQGYWWARDATANDPSNWLSNSDVREQIRSIKSKHTLLISDACFSGGIFRTRSAATLQQASIDVQMLYKLPSRRAITSGTLTTVPDKSVFFEYLVKRLEENTTDFMTSQQLFDSFRQAVINNSMVVPQDGVIAEAGDEGGDFVFVKKR